MRALMLLCINKQSKFKVPSFTNSKDMIGAKFKKRETKIADLNLPTYPPGGRV